MQVILLYIVKYSMQIVFNISKILNKYRYDAIVVGNYNHITVDQKLLLERLSNAGITWSFLFTTEKPKFTQKVLAYIRLSWMLPMAKNILVYDYCFPIYCIKKPYLQKHIQLWHGNGSFKKFGLPTFYEKHGNALGEKLYKVVPIHSTYDFVFVSNEKCIPHYMNAFGIFEPEKFIVSNNAILNMITSAKDQNRKPFDPNNITVICAPTYNYNPESNMYEDLEKHLIALGVDKNINVRFLKLLHPKLVPAFDKIGTLIETDFLITDYSSVCFEAEGAGVQVAFLRSDETAEVYVEVAKKVYKDPKELAEDILSNCVPNSHLDKFLCPDPDLNQIDITIDLIKRNRK